MWDVAEGGVGQNDYICRKFDTDMTIHLVYFSATYTTRSVLRGIAGHWTGAVVEHDITAQAPAVPVQLGDDDLLLFGAPVYCGRIPEEAALRLRSFRGAGTRAVAVAVYGNRHYDEALAEMQDLLSGQGFRLVAAAAFIGRHCIFPEVASGRPDAADAERMAAFAEACRPVLEAPAGALGDVKVPGSGELPPYKRVPFCPMPTDECTQCGQCAELCPVGTISAEDVTKVDASRCIACGRCVVVCPVGGRRFGGEAYAAASAHFVAAFSARREPEWFVATLK